MKRFLPLMFVLAICSFSSPFTFAQDFPYQEYKTRTLSELIAMDDVEANKDFANGKGQMIIHTKPFYSAVRVKYIGTSKLVTKEEKDYLKLWQGTLGYPEEIPQMYENKYLFKECDKEYWIPVQKQVAAYFQKELKENDMITLYLMYPGGIKLKPTDNWNFIFLVNEYQKYQD